jgi:hypothetical protein
MKAKVKIWRGKLFHKHYAILINYKRELAKIIQNLYPFSKSLL